MTVLRRIFSIPYSQILVLLTASLYIQTANATGLDPLNILSPGSTAIISIDPVLPKQGEPFTINVTGQWRDNCIPDQDKVTYKVGESYKGYITVETILDRTNDCGDEFEPTTYKLSVKVLGSDWEVFFNSQRSVIINLVVRDPLYPLPDDRLAGTYWTGEFDLNLGLHAISPRLGSGYWLSEGTPYQGLLIQQQGNTVVFYELKYNRTSGEPNWHYATGRFDGNSLNSVAYLINWLSPVDGINPKYGLGLAHPPINKLVQPERQELLFDTSSAGLDVRGVNRIVAFIGLINGVTPVGYEYKRWVFDLDDTQLPPVVPDMVGPWNLYGFNGQKLEQSHQIEFRAGTKVGDDLYRFSSLDDEWVMDCQVNMDGEGGCNLTSEGLGLTMNYELDPTISHEAYYYGTTFNGNYANAPLVSSNIDEADQIGILLRSGLHLPVLDLQ